MTDERMLSLEKIHAALGWPTPTDVTHPKGAGAAVFASLAREKIGRTLAHFEDGAQARIGVLMANPNDADTNPPLALVVDFQRSVSEITLRELHRLCWNFSHTPVLITIEPGVLRAWTCCEAPDAERSFSEFQVHKLSSADFASTRDGQLESSAARALHWINLVSGEFFSQHAQRFDRDGRADQMLLGNLRHIRAKLAEAGLQDDDVCHDLLARVIFVQFLFDRKDADGVPALTPARLARLHTDGVLARLHSSFDGVLASYRDSYKLFDWLNERFNGDLFPGKGDTPAARAIGWAKEKRVVSKAHLALLADFIRGNVDMPSGQRCLWPLYSFDVIPLEFISSIYETFVTERASADGIFYTPPHLVDFILDRVLPWNSTDWDIKVLDPACGSGIFLVKAFQRLVHRWKQAHPAQTIRAETLRNLLERNILGIDKDPHAVRVACFSLYLAMCDEIEPRHYWSQIVFPPMRHRRLICSDFFEEARAGFDTITDASTYDLIVGNAPWGDGLVTELALNWAAEAHPAKWTVANKDIGGLFLAKAGCLLKDRGRIAMIQSANSLLFNAGRPAVKFRKELLSTYRVDEIYNLSALRFKVFKRKSHTTKTSVSPACIVVMGKARPSPDDRISYICPKHLKPLVDEFNIVIEPNDRRSLSVSEALSDDNLWVTLMWGRARDRVLIKKLQRFPSLATPGGNYEVRSREGIVFGDRTRSEPQLNQRQLFNSRTFPNDSLLHIDVDEIPVAWKVKTHSRDSTDFRAFTWPQLLIKQGWQKTSGRFQARLTRSTNRSGVLCTQSYVSVHAEEELLEAACLSLNSMLAVYFLQLTSGRIAAYRPETLVQELLAVPVPPINTGLLEKVHSYSDIDTRIFKAFGLNAAEVALIEDLVQYTVADFRDADVLRPDNGSSGKADEPQLRAYCEYFIRVLQAGFGTTKAIGATIFQTKHDSPLPYQLIAFELGRDDEDHIKVEEVKTSALLHELERLDGAMGQSTRIGIYNTRVARIYDSTGGTPTVFVVKPNLASYWTRSTALNDGDEVALDLFRWQQSAGRGEAEV